MALRGQTGEKKIFFPSKTFVFRSLFLYLCKQINIRIDRRGGATPLSELRLYPYNLMQIMLP
ncbi:hypothetical protein HMPREF3226_00820 [Prevotella corporis]|uniref:Uncharacterized protein n=1 Tax=Prevotella corporis TaxID=28128 RepID=A0A133QF92_9BACT|nr:hypothetical protein HMPREF3226_00820 [Prevotella corporis]